MSKCKYYKPYMDTLKLLVKKFHELENCGSGGPLHVLTDDNNYDIGSVNFCIKYAMDDIQEGPDAFNPPHVNVLAVMIANEYAKMTLEERAVFDAYSCGQKLDCCGCCEECELLGELYDYMKESEDRYYDKT